MDLRTLALASVAASAVLASATSRVALAQPQSTYVCDDFPLPTDGALSELKAAGDGSVWYADRNANRLIHVGRDRGAIAIVPGDAAAGALFGIAIAADGAIWYSKDKSDRIGRISVAGAKATEFELPPPNVFPRAIAAAPDGRTWYVDPVVNKVGNVTVDGRVVTYDAPSVNGSPADPTSIAIGEDGSAWVTSIGHNAVYRVDSAGGAFTRYDVATPNAQPTTIVRGKQGDFWFLMPAVSEIGRITSDGSITEYPAKLVGLQDVIVGPDGATWYSSRQGIGRIDPSSGRATTFACGGFGGMAIGPDGHLWVLGDKHMYVVRSRAEGRAALQR
jgi:virginiamycin B lyase